MKRLKAKLRSTLKRSTTLDDSGLSFDKELTFRASAPRQSDGEGLTFETSAFNLFKVANLRYQLS